MFILIELLTNKPQRLDSRASFCTAYGELIILRVCCLLRFVCRVPSGFRGDVGGLGTWRASVKIHGRYINNHSTLFKYRLPLLLLAKVLQDRLG